MDFVELLSDTTHRRRLLGGFAALLILAVAFAGLGIALDMPSLWVLSLVLLAGLVGVAGKLLSAVAVYLNGTTKRLKVLNDRYDDTEIWLEQFDKGTRATFANLSASLREASAQREALASRMEADRAESQSQAAKTEATVATLASREALDVAVNAAIKSADEASAKIAGALADARAEIARVSSDLGKVASDVGKQAQASDAVAAKAAAQIAEHARQIAQLLESGKRLDAAAASAAGEIESVKRAMGQRIDALGEKQDSATKAATEQARKELIESASRLEAINAGLSVAASQASRLRNEGYAQFTRQISDTFVEAVQGEMGTRLGLKIAPRELRYLERKVQQIEAVCEGRLATTAEDAITRVLAARSLRTDELKVLEIGVLFGVGAAFMHTALAPFYKRVHLVLLDPFDGYYGSDHLDPLTGQKVTRAAVERNLTRASIRPDDTTVLEGFSTDDAVFNAAKQAGPYDVIVIDGDHSYEGVKADFTRYADMVRPGGILIVDDYGSKDWPDVTRFVDTVVSADKRFENLGAYSRTAIFRRQAAATAKPAPAAKVADAGKALKTAPVTAKPSKPALAAAAAKKKAPAQRTPKDEAAAEPVVVRTKSAKNPKTGKSGVSEESARSASPRA